MSEPNPELEARLARIEAAITWLVEQEQRRALSVQAPFQASAPAPTRAPGAVPLDLASSSAPIPGSLGVLPAATKAPPREPISSAVWVAGIGGVIFLIGTAFLLRYSIMQGWIGPELRFAGALGFGLLLSAIAGRLILGTGPRLGVAILFAGLGVLNLAFRVGAITYGFFPASLGLAGIFVSTLIAGGLAARSGSGGALSVAVISAFVAPIMMSQGGHHEVELLAYLAVVMAAVTLVPYLSKHGEKWTFARWLALAGTWSYVLFCCSDVTHDDDAKVLLALVGLHHLLAGLWIWLPGRPFIHPRAPGTQWLLTSLLASLALWILWDQLEWPQEVFSLIALAYAALHLWLVVPMRRRAAGRGAQSSLFALSGGHLALAVPMALAWQWVGTTWGVFGLILVILRRVRQRAAIDATDEVVAQKWLARGFAGLALVAWLVDQGSGRTIGETIGDSSLPFASLTFVEGVLAAILWLMLIENTVWGILALIVAQFVIHFVIAQELAYVGTMWSEFERLAAIATTLIWALSGAGQWISGLRVHNERRRLALTIGGYVWLGIAGFKLIAFDLDGFDTPLRAVAFLGVGTIFLLAALLGHRLRGESK